MARTKSNKLALEESKVSENAGKQTETVKSAKRGRVSTFTDEIAHEICERISVGEPLRQICRDDHMPHWTTVYAWREANEDFALRIARARELGEEAIAQECLMIADTPQIGQKSVSKATGIEITEADMIEHRRLQIDTRLKLLAKWNPKKWGEKVAIGGAADLPPVETNNTLNVTGLSTAALEEIMRLKDATQPS